MYYYFIFFNRAWFLLCLWCKKTESFPLTIQNILFSVITLKYYISPPPLWLSISQISLLLFSLPSNTFPLESHDLIHFSWDHLWFWELLCVSEPIGTLVWELYFLLLSFLSPHSDSFSCAEIWGKEEDIYHHKTFVSPVWEAAMESNFCTCLFKLSHKYMA